jgi:hypothetical protein
MFHTNGNYYKARMAIKSWATILTLISLIRDSDMDGMTKRGEDTHSLEQADYDFEEKDIGKCCLRT